MKDAYAQASKALAEASKAAEKMTEATAQWVAAQGSKGHCQSKFYTACLRTWVGQSSAVFAHKSRTRPARFDAENGLP